MTAPEYKIVASNGEVFEFEYSDLPQIAQQLRLNDRGMEKVEKMNVGQVFNLGDGWTLARVK